MCHRFQQLAKQRAIAEHFDATSLASETSDQKDLFPLHYVLVVRPEESDQRELVHLQWGFIPSKWQPTSRYPNRKKYQRERFNARSEAVHQTWAYRDAFRTKRALIPATAFYEQGHYFSLPDDPIFAFAGLWDHWESDGQVVESCNILTTEANDLVAKVHPRKRMPVILAGEEAWQLTSSSPPDILKMFQAQQHRIAQLEQQVAGLSDLEEAIRRQPGVETRFVSIESDVAMLNQHFTNAGTVDSLQQYGDDESLWSDCNETCWEVGYAHVFAKPHFENNVAFQTTDVPNPLRAKTLSCGATSAQRLVD